ncbi:MAG: hypothetical protein AB1330_01790 [Bacillota bacterium]
MFEDAVPEKPNFARHKRMAPYLFEAAVRGFPDIEGFEREREAALRIYQGETMTSIARSAGLGRERVRQLAMAYLGAVCYGNRRKRRYNRPRSLVEDKDIRGKG